MKNSFKYILSAASFLFMAAGVSFAQDLEAHKSVASNDKGGYTLTLEAWATGEQVQRTETVAQPLDIVLVLDVSGSMNEPFGTEKVSVKETKYSQSNDKISSINNFSKTEYYYSGSNCNFYKRITSSERKSGWLIVTYYYYTITLEDGTTVDVDDDYKPYIKSTTTTTRTKTRLDALKDACSAFISTISTKAAEDDCDHQISVVKFASDASDNIGNDFVYTTGSGTKYYPTFFNRSQVVLGLTNNYNSVLESIKELQYGGATHSDFGMEYAKSILSTVTREDSHKVVVMFTDGTPGTSGWDATVANDAIAASKELKEDNVIVYTVGIFDTNSDNVTKYMNYVSSNYPSAESMTEAGNSASDKYFMTADNPAELENVFTTISQDASDAAETTELTSETSSIRDYVTPQFNLDGEPSDVRIFTVNANSKDSFDESSKSDNLNGQPNGKPGETFAVAFQDGEKAGEKKVVVTGFDFKSHWVGEVKDETSGQNSYNKDGQKIVIEIDIVLAGDASGVIETNTSDSGIYAYDSTTGENIQEAEFTKVGIGFPVPQAVNPGPAYLKIVNNFLENVGPQSAVFEIKDEEGNVLYNVMLTDSNNQATVKVDWLDLEEGETVDSENLGDKMKSFTVTEKGWSMNEISRADSTVNTLWKWDDVNKKWVENVFIFNSGAESEVEHAETYVLDVN